MFCLSYLISHWRAGAFSLLRPALVAVERHRPKDPHTYVATFLATAVKSASVSNGAGDGEQVVVAAQAS